ncbi:alpha/beta-hydrolase, partial [Gloeophyllum trabeum ATCC 11539]
PIVTFDPGDSWAGLLPISSNANETRKLFFWFWPAVNESRSQDFIFWTNGGPGCSSLEGLLQENGPISWSWGQAQPTQRVLVLNPWSWTNLANVIWVDQPVGTGFSEGTPDIADDSDLARELVGFLQQFLAVFTELSGSNFYLTGESFAGFYIPYIANYIYENPGILDLNLQGIWLSDPSISHDVVEYDIPAFGFVKENQALFPLNSTFMSHIEQASNSCGYTTYVDTYATYPPAGPLPLPGGTVKIPSQCKIRDAVTSAMQLINPAFTKYRVSNAWPIPCKYVPLMCTIVTLSLSCCRTDVQDAIHAPHKNWVGCTTEGLYTGGQDTSTPSALSILPSVIERSTRTVIAQGLFVGCYRRNMTWGGKQGFQTPIEPESFNVEDVMGGTGVSGIYGNMHTERSLTYVEFYFSGHYTPQFVPWAAYQTVEYLVGLRECPSSNLTDCT